MAFSCSVLRHLAREAERLGIDASHLLAGIWEQALLAQDDLWVPDRDMFEIVSRALRASPKPGLGLRLGAGGSFMAVGVTGMLLSVSESFRDVLRAMVHFQRAVHDKNAGWLKEDRTTLTLELPRLEGPIEYQECMMEFFTSNLSTMLTRFAGPAARLTSVFFSYPAPAHVAAYTAALECQLQFAQPRSRLVVDAALADRVQMLSQPSLAEQLWHFAEQELIRLSRQHNIVDDVRDVLSVDWGARPPSVAATARRLGLSERSLRRLLAKLNVDYRSLVAERQHELASQMLRREGMSVKEVAHRLGYDSQSAFHRAFRRWTGASTKEYRRTGY